MKDNWKYLIILLACFIFAGCSDEELVEENIPMIGDDIVFGANASIEKTEFSNMSKTSRTAYGNPDVVNGKIPLHWCIGDQITIGCPQAGGKQLATYAIPTGNHKVGDTITSKVDTLSRVTEVAGLQWGEGHHDFSAVYPSVEKVPEQKLKLDLGTNKLYGVMPSSYVPMSLEPTKKADGKRHYKIMPSMDYAFMVADTAYTQAQAAVSLDFKPIVTVVEFDLVFGKYLQETGTTAIYLNQMVLSSKSNSIVGDFEYDFSHNKVQNTSKYESGTNKVTLHFNKRVLVEADDTISVTFFVIPSDGTTLTAGDLSLDIMYEDQTGGAFFKKATVNTHIQPRKKYAFKNLKLPDLNPLTSSNWFAHMDDDIYISQLSFPCAAHVVSNQYAASGGTNPQYHQLQRYPFRDLWKQGVRGYELVSSFKTADGKTCTAKDFENTPFICAGKELKGLQGEETAGHGSLGVGGAIRNGYDNLHLTLKGKDGKESQPNINETMVYVMTYQSYGGDNSLGYRPDVYLTGLQNFLDQLVIDRKITNLDDAFVQIGTQSTVKDLRGKIAIIVRLYDEHYVGIPSNKDIVRANLKPNAKWSKYITVIDDWGTCIDNWDVRYGSYYAREGAFTDNPSRQFERHMWWGISDSDTDWHKIGYGVWDDHPETTPFPAYGKDNYVGYKFNINKGVGLPKGESPTKDFAWVQCWERVISPKQQKFYLGSSAWWEGTTTAFLWYQWHESLSEKVAAMQHVAREAMNSRGNARHILYINSLAGYFPAKHGDFEGSCNPYMQTDETSEVYTWRTDGSVLSLSGRRLNLVDHKFFGHQTGGDYAACCGILNLEMYDYIKYTPSDKLGPLGLVMIGYIGGDVSDFKNVKNYQEKISDQMAAAGSQALPKLILQNNFEFPLKKKKQAINTDSDCPQIIEGNNNIISFE